MQRIERILVGFDFSPCSTRALRYAIDVAKVTEADLDILFVEVLHGEAFNEATREKLTQLVSEQLETRDASDLNVKIAVERYFAAAPAILDYADNNDIDLIIVGTHGRRGLRGLMLGSVAQETVRHASVPVLTVRGKGDRKISEPKVDRILVPFDFSDHSRRALANAVEIASTFHSVIVLAHVIEDRFHPAFYGPFFQSILDLDPDIQHKSEAHLREEIVDFLDSGLEFEIIAFPGHPATTIAAFAEENDIDLIVMSTHGLTGLEKLSFGSVAERTVSSARCPVLTLRNPSREKSDDRAPSKALRSQEV